MKLALTLMLCMSSGLLVALFMRWLSRQGTIRSVIDWEYLGEGRYRLEYEWLHRGEWFGGWVVGSRNEWTAEETSKRVHWRVEAWLCEHWAALERGRAKRDQPVQQSEVLRCHQL